MSECIFGEGITHKFPIDFVKIPRVIMEASGGGFKSQPHVATPLSSYEVLDVCHYVRCPFLLSVTCMYLFPKNWFEFS